MCPTPRRRFLRVDSPDHDLHPTRRAQNPATPDAEQPDAMKGAGPPLLVGCFPSAGSGVLMPTGTARGGSLWTNRRQDNR
jgi:hypothetical protein